MSPSLSTSLWCTATFPREWESLAITRFGAFVHTQVSLHSGSLKQECKKILYVSLAVHTVLLGSAGFPKRYKFIRLFFRFRQASDWEKLQKTLADALEHYNELHAVMDLVLFEEAIQHV